MILAVNAVDENTKNCGGILPTVNLNMVRLKNADSIRSDEGPMLEKSA